MIARVPVYLLRAAFSNPVSEDLIQEYAQVIDLLPPIKGYCRRINCCDIGEKFLAGEEIAEDHVGLPSWFITDGYHRAFAAIEAGKESILVEEDDD